MKKPRWKKIDWGHYQLQDHSGAVFGTIRENFKTGWWHTHLGARGKLLGKHKTLNEARSRVKEATQALKPQVGIWA